MFFSCHLTPLCVTGYSHSFPASVTAAKLLQSCLTLCNPMDYSVPRFPATAAAKSLQSCLTLCDHIDGSPTRLPSPCDSPGKNTEVGCHFRLQCMKVKVKSVSRVQLFATPWTVAYQAPPIMGFSRQEYWSGLPFPSPMHESEK